MTGQELELVRLVGVGVVLWAAIGAPPGWRGWVIGAVAVLASAILTTTMAGDQPGHWFAGTVARAGGVWITARFVRAFARVVRRQLP